MPNMYKDKKGHWTNKENAGGPCNHGSGSKGTPNEKDKAGKLLGVDLNDKGSLNVPLGIDEISLMSDEDLKTLEELVIPGQDVADEDKSKPSASFDDDYDEEFYDYTDDTKPSADPYEIEDYISNENDPYIDPNEIILNIMDDYYGGLEYGTKEYEDAFDKVQQQVDDYFSNRKSQYEDDDFDNELFQEDFYNVKERKLPNKNAKKQFFDFKFPRNIKRSK